MTHAFLGTAEIEGYEPDLCGILGGATTTAECAGGSRVEGV